VRAQFGGVVVLVLTTYEAHAMTSRGGRKPMSTDEKTRRMAIGSAKTRRRRELQMQTDGRMAIHVMSVDEWARATRLPPRFRVHDHVGLLLQPKHAFSPYYSTEEYSVFIHTSPPSRSIVTHSGHHTAIEAMSHTHVCSRSVFTPQLSLVSLCVASCLRSLSSL
jgi:hypothetical protein